MPRLIFGVKNTRIYRIGRVCFNFSGAHYDLISLPFNLISCDATDSSFVPPLIYAFMGSSRDIAIGPVAVVSLLLGSLLQDEIDPETDMHNYLRLAFTATFFAGIVQAALGILR